MMWISVAYPVRLSSAVDDGFVGFTPVLRTLRVLMCEQDAPCLVNAVNDRILSS
jgi:hypothetical protein